MESRWRIIYITCGKEVNGNEDGWTDTQAGAFAFFETCVKNDPNSAVRLDKLVGSQWVAVKEAGHDRYARHLVKN